MATMDRRFNIRMSADDARPYEEMARALGVPAPRLMRQALREFSPYYRQLVAMAAMAQQGQAEEALQGFEAVVKQMMGEGQRMLAESQEVREALSVSEEEDREAS